MRISSSGDAAARSRPGSSSSSAAISSAATIDSPAEARVGQHAGQLGELPDEASSRCARACAPARTTPPRVASRPPATARTVPNQRDQQPAGDAGQQRQGDGAAAAHGRGPGRELQLQAAAPARARRTRVTAGARGGAVRGSGAVSRPRARAALARRAPPRAGTARRQPIADEQDRRERQRAGPGAGHSPASRSGVKSPVGGPEERLGTGSAGEHQALERSGGQRVVRKRPVTRRSGPIGSRLEGADRGQPEVSRRREARAATSTMRRRPSAARSSWTITSIAALIWSRSASKGTSTSLIDASVSSRRSASSARVGVHGGRATRRGRCSSPAACRASRRRGPRRR